MLGLVAVSAMPDLDSVGFLFGVPYEHPLGHRGFSHSLLFAALVALCAPSLVLWGRELPKRTWAALVGVFFIAGASHGFIDAFTNAGLGIGFLLPFDETRFFFPWRPIITASVDPRDFFESRGLEILRNEIGWIWAPATCASLALIAIRRWSSRQSGPGSEGLTVRSAPISRSRAEEKPR